MIKLILLDIFLSIISIIPKWNLENFAKDLLAESNPYTYTIADREMYDLLAHLEKTITKEGSTITHKNKLVIKNTDTNDRNEKTCENVNFENIESFYKLGKRLLCALGKHHPIDLDNSCTEITNGNINSEKEWDLKCYRHDYDPKFFLVFYFKYGENQLYNLDYSNNNYVFLDKSSFKDELYDFKLVNSKTGEWTAAPFPIIALIKLDGYIQFVASGFKFGTNMDRNTDLNITLTLAKKYTEGYFSNDTAHFYFFTYNNASDFTSGYSTNTSIYPQLYNINCIKYKINETSPFKFLDEVEIEEMKFLFYTNFAYYRILNKKTNKKYHGILDVTKNQIMFNTDEDIDTFIPYSNNAMLIITPEKAYKICIIYENSKDGQCLSECASN